MGQPTILESALTDETEAAAFTNLLTLGFDPMLMERKHVTSFDRRMLCKTNAKGMEIAPLSDSTRLHQQCAQELTLLLAHLR